MKPQKICFNHNWEFYDGNIDIEKDIESEQVTIPHSYSDKEYVSGYEWVEKETNIKWYRKVFTLPKLEQGQRVLIEFEGIENTSKVYVDGSYVGGRVGAYLGYWIDVTDVLADTENHEIKVKVDNAFHPHYCPPKYIDWVRYGGIYRDTWLHIKNEAYFDYAGVQIKTPVVSKENACVEIKSKIVNAQRESNYTIVNRLLDEDNNEIAAVSYEEKYVGNLHTREKVIGMENIQNPKLWSIESPILYKVVSELYEEDLLLDQVENRIGFRYFEFDNEKGCFLNGEPIKLLGCNNHQEYPGLGHGCPDRFHVEDMKLMKDMGCNYLRGAHYPRNKKCLDACDEIGILVIEEQPLWHGSLRAEHGEEFLYNTKRVIRDMVKQHGNHPSIIMWNTINEVFLTPNFSKSRKHLEPGEKPVGYTASLGEHEHAYAKRVIAEVYNELKAADPYRLVSVVVGRHWDINNALGITDIGDVTGYNGGSLNYRRPPVYMEDTKKEYNLIIDYIHDKYPEQKVMMSEGVINDRPCRRGEWEKEAVHWEVHASYWNDFYQRDWFAGGSMWCFTDYRTYGMTRIMGAMDVTRLPYETYYFYKAMWGNESFLHILTHWDWKEDNFNKRVVVFSNCEEVELFLNGRSLGKGRSVSEQYPHIPHAPYVWDGIEFEAGQLEARGKIGDAIIYDTRNTSDAPAKIILNTSTDTIQGDGRDITFVEASICDEQGNRCYNFFGNVEMECIGAAYVPEESETEVRGGMVRFAVRSDGEKGKAEIIVKGHLLNEGTAIIQCA